MNRQRILKIFLLTYFGIPILFFLSVASAFSQQTGIGRISGSVSNSSSQPLAGVEVRAIISSGSYYDRIVYTASDGSFDIQNLPVGQYYLRIFNKLGYINVYHDDVLNKDDATLIKLNYGQHVQGVNFYLQNGGFISGTIFDEYGVPVESSSSIAFLDEETYNSRGVINSNPDGSYVSPALPANPHILKASSFPGGYMLTYFDNVSTQDSALAVYVSQGDTIKNIDFYLRKGGAISGYVHGDNPGHEPVANAWIVVTNWDNGEWSSESKSDSNGYYCAAGLRPGNYRVHVYSVDPLLYHTEYYNDTPQRINAIPVSVSAGDTTRNINFDLQPVRRLVVGNDFLEFCVSDRYPGTNLSLWITGGLPETIHDNDKPLLFGHPFPYTSFTTIRMDGEDVIYGSSAGNMTGNVYIKSDGKSIERTWEYKNVSIEQKISLVVSEWSEAKYEDTAQIQYVIRNNDATSHDVGVRILLDTMLGNDDAAPIRTSDYTYSNYERTFYAHNMPDWWAAMEADNRKTIFSAQGTLIGYGAITPDQFSTLNWSNAFKTKWDYRTSGDVGVIYDSGVGLWWYPETIAPGMTKIVCTYLGLGEMFPDDAPPYTANHFPAKDSTNISRDTNIQLDILDDYMGVDSTRINMSVNGEIVNPVITGNPSRFTVNFQPPQIFRYNDTVRVKIDAADLAIEPNDMETDEYVFFVIRDSLSPYIEDLYPAADFTNIKSDTALNFSIFDDQSGVDSSSIQVKLNGVQARSIISGDSVGYAVTCPFEPPFGEMETVAVNISANDLARPANSLNLEYEFITARDSLPPFVSFNYPGNNEVEIERDTTIQIHLRDDYSGIDVQSIRMMMDSVLVAPIMEIYDSCHVGLSYAPESGFQFNDHVFVQIEASDRAKQPNAMAPFQFEFSTVTDIEPPYITSRVPAPNDTSVAPSPGISIEIADEKAGVDSSTIALLINDAIVPFQLSGNKYLYQVNYQFEHPLNYMEWVDVAIVAADFSNPANAMDTSRYTFRITREKDLAPPYVTLWQPSPGSDDVLPDCLISFHVKDDMSGVDSSSVMLKINNKLTSSRPKISGDLHDYLVQYQPPEPFTYGEEIVVHVDAKDLAIEQPNIMETDSWLFSILPDTTQPAVEWIAPGQPGTHIALNSQFIFDIVDELTGIDMASLRFKFQDEKIEPEISGDINKLRINYSPESSLNYNQQIKFVVTGHDLASPSNLMKDTLFYFYTLEDHDPPYTTAHIPAKNETNVDFETEIRVNVCDDIAGVDLSTIWMTVEGDTVSPLITGMSQCYQLYYKRELPGFRPGQRVHVTVGCSDLSNPPLKMQPDNYEFSIQDVYPDLYVEAFHSNKNKILVHQPIELHGLFRASVAPTFDSIRVEVRNNNRTVFTNTFSPLKVDGQADFTSSVSFETKGTHRLRMTLDPENKIKESNEENNSAEISIQVTEGDLIVRSNPFTPNGDGVNDLVTFNFEKVSILKPSLKLFDISGRAIATLIEYDGYKFTWDGRDRYGNPAQPGVYLYLLQDSEKVVANGYVVIAR